MYHYVRDLKHSRYSDIKGLDFCLFKEQIEYLKKHYQIISTEELIDSIDNKTPLPKKAVLLTFDDAYADHYKYVFPFLDEQGIQGTFYPPVKAIEEHSVLDVNKIHFTLAAEHNNSKITTEIKRLLKQHKEEFELNTYDYYYQKLAHQTRLDSAEAIFIKRLLQVELAQPARKLITDKLFEQFVGMDEESFSRELYMDIDQLKCMHRNGMHIGSHGYDHFWLSSLSKEEQKMEITKSLSFLKQIRGDLKKWTMCYPYGDYNDQTLEILKEFDCKLALSTKVGIANLSTDNKYILPRLDTNDIPKDSNAKTNKWFALG